MTVGKDSSLKSRASGSSAGPDLGLVLLRPEAESGLRERQPRHVEFKRPGDNKWSMTIFARDLETGMAKWVYR